LNPIGKRIKALIVKVDKEKQSVIVSRKDLIEREKKEIQEIVDKLLKDKAVVLGVVKKITSYGMFVDVGGLNGLVHLTSKIIPPLKGPGLKFPWQKHFLKGGVDWRGSHGWLRLIRNFRIRKGKERHPYSLNSYFQGGIGLNFPQGTPLGKGIIRIKEGYSKGRLGLELTG